MNYKLNLVYFNEILIHSYNPLVQLCKKLK